MSWARQARYRMGTIWEMAVRSSDRGRALSALDGAFAAVGSLERLMSRFLPDSQVQRLTEAAGRTAVPVDRDLCQVLGQAQEVSAASAGAFDVTLGPLVALWSRAGREGALPPPEALRAARACVDHRALDLSADGPSARLRHGGMSVDLGAIGKGAAVDRAVERLRGDGYTQGWVNAGGNVRFLGAWDRAVPVRDPCAPDRACARLMVEHGALATSGNYERGWRIGGRWYGHLLDPRTGWPASACLSATVLAPSAALADALSTACFVLGPGPGRALCRLFSGVEAFWLGGAAAPGFLDATPGVRGRIRSATGGRADWEGADAVVSMASS